MTDIIDISIIRFEPSPNIADQEQLTAAVDAIETYVSVDLGIDGLWIISIDGETWPMEWPGKAIEMLETMEDHAEAGDRIIDDLRKAIHDMMAHAGAVHPDIGCRAVIERGKEALEKHRRAGS